MSDFQGQKICNKKIINLHKLSCGDKERLVNALYPCFSQRISGWSKQRFAEEIFFKEIAYWSLIQIYFNAEKKEVGFTAFHVFKKKFAGRNSYFLKYYFVINNKYAKNNIMPLMGVFLMLKFKLFHPFQKSYLIDFMMSPMAFYQVTKHFSKLYPHPEKPAPEKVKKLLFYFAREFNIVLKDKDNFVGQAEETVRLNDSEKEFWRNHPNKFVRFFVEKAGLDGDGFIIFIHVTYIKIIHTAINILITRIYKLLRSLSSNIW